MYCENCGSKLQNDDMFCSNCGAKTSLVENSVHSENNSKNSKDNFVAEGNVNRSNVNYSISFDSAFINETINYIKNLFTNPIETLIKSSNLSTASICTILALSLIINILSFNFFFKDTVFFDFLNNGKMIFSLFIYYLGFSTSLFVCSITIAHKSIAWTNLLKLSVIISLIFSVGSFISLIFNSLSIVITLLLLYLTLTITLLLNYESFLRITSTTAKIAKISLVISYLIMIFLFFLCFMIF